VNPHGLHLARRLQHALSGLTLLAVTYTPVLVEHWTACLLALCFGAGVVLVLHWWRLHDERVQALLLKTYGPLARPREMDDKRIPGAFWFMLGIACALLATQLCRPLPEGLGALRAAMLFLSLGDPMAGIAGRMFPASPRLPGSDKTWAGCLACFLTCTCCAATQSHDLAWCWYAGMVGALSEAAQPAQLDDNFWIPLASVLGLAMAPAPHSL
jgi:dolichol kinase